MLQITPKLAATATVGPILAATLKVVPSFGIGVSLTGSLERALYIPLWDGSVPEWIKEDFILLDSGHFWVGESITINS